MFGTGGMLILWPQGQSSREGGGKTSSQIMGLCPAVPQGAVLGNAIDNLPLDHLLQLSLSNTILTACNKEERGTVNEWAIMCGIVSVCQ